MVPKSLLDNINQLLKHTFFSVSVHMLDAPIAQSCNNKTDWGNQLVSNH